jgi:hypothetical protein
LEGGSVYLQKGRTRQMFTGRMFVMKHREWQTAAFLWLEFHLFTQLTLCVDAIGEGDKSEAALPPSWSEGDLKQG